MKKLVLAFLLFFTPTSVLAFSDTAKSSIVMDIDSGRILYQKNANEKRLIASITKIMTATLALESGKLKEQVTAGEEVLKMYGTSIYIQKGETMSLQDLVYGLMLRSGNDAAVVIANYLAGTEENFVKEMNQKAKEIGMKNTIFENSHGLDEETQNYSTAKDMALLNRYAYKNLKKYREISGTYKHIVKTEDKTYLWYNRNKLLNSYEYCTGGKNGYTPSAGKTLVTTAEKDGLRITTVTLADNNEYENHKNLDEMVFDQYSLYQIIDKDNFSISSDQLKGTAYIKESFSYPLTEEEADNTKVIAQMDPTIQTGKIGNISIQLYNKEIKRIPIYLKEKKKKSFFKFF